MTVKAGSRADLHVHSLHSERPSFWVLQKLGAPESYTDPQEVYRICRSRGMDFVTITDHNRIEGCLEIAHLPGTFTGVETTTYFPENGCKIHCLAYGFTEAQFGMIQKLRENIYDLRNYLQREKIVHSIAHPLYSINGKLDLGVFEKLLVLFNRFEGLNGSRHPRASTIATAIIEGLDRETLYRLAAKHKLEPHGKEPWIKSLTGGSDDHGGLHCACAYTETPKCETPGEHLRLLASGGHFSGGRAGTSFRLAHTIYRIAFLFYKSKLSPESAGTSFLGSVVRRLAGVPVGRRLIQGYRTRSLSRNEKLILKAFDSLFSADGFEATHCDGDGSDMERFDHACEITQQVALGCATAMVGKLKSGRFLESFQSLASMAPVALAVAPYVSAFAAQHKDEVLLKNAASAFPASHHLVERSGKTVWITDSMPGMPDIRRSIRTLRGQLAGYPPDVMCLGADSGLPGGVFRPVGRLKVPELNNMIIGFPPFLKMLGEIEKAEYDHMMIASPGPAGLVGLLGAELLGIRAEALFTRNLVPIRKRNAEDDGLYELAWRYYRWFYSRVETTWFSSEQTGLLLKEQEITNARRLRPGSRQP